MPERTTVRGGSEPAAGRVTQEVLREVPGVYVEADWVLRFRNLTPRKQAWAVEDLQFLSRPELQGLPAHFVEDRLPTLERLLASGAREFAALRLYLADWGYVTPHELACARSDMRITVIAPDDFLSR